MPNKNPKTTHLPKQETQWQHLPTIALRVPEIFLDEIRDYAIALDSKDVEVILELIQKLSLIVQEKSASNHSLENYILYLANDPTFNDINGNFGNWLVNVIKNKRPIIRSVAYSAFQLIEKYKEYLKEGNLLLPDWNLIKDQYPEKLADIKDDLIALYNPYDEIFIKNCKELKGKFDNSDKSWCFPLKKIIEVYEKVIGSNFHLSLKFKEEIDLHQKKLAEEKAKKEGEMLEKANEIINLVKAAKLDEPLNNGWYLRDYQKQGAEWLLSHRDGIYKGGILADHMGLGKTLTALAAAKAMQSTHGCSVFVIAPISIINNWVREAEKIKVKIECFSWAKIPKPLETQNYILICDEAQYAQNINSRRTKAMLELSHSKNCLATWLLTGTPMKNGKPVNLYPLLFALNHPLAKDKWEYERRYCNACYKYVGNKSVWDNTGSSCLDELSIKTQDVILRRTKAQCLPELPIKTRLFIQCELEMAAAKDYQEKLLFLVNDYRQRVKEGKVSGDAEALVTLNYLRKIGSEFKIQTAIGLAEELLDQGEQVIIFTEFLETADAIASRLGGLLLTGQTKAEDRQQLVDDFQNGKNKIFVGTTKAGGVGLNLTAASNVILVDRPWTPGDVEQTEDRCHRLGQSNAVFSTWIQLGEIDKYSDELIQLKQEKIELVLRGKCKTIKFDSVIELAKELLEIL
ncbi:MAG: DEAD/DEAH box helicase [Flammeovirgaceae bacterium]